MLISRLFILLSLLAPSIGLSKNWLVILPPTAPRAVELAALDISKYLGMMGYQTNLVRDLANRDCSETNSIIFTHGKLTQEELPKDYTEQTWSFRIKPCQDSRKVILAGGGLMGQQYAAYQFLRQLGVRFFHPEEEYVPRRAKWPKTSLHKFHTPSFKRRGVSLHLTHPLELGDIFRSNDRRYLDEGKRYIDWLIKNMANEGVDGGPNELQIYRKMRGLPTVAHLSLYGTQQGGKPVIDPDSPLSEEEQMKIAIDRMMATAEFRPSRMVISVNHTEFDHTHDLTSVRLLTFFADYMARTYPEVEPITVNHGSHSELSPNYGIRMSNLSALAPKNLSVMAHTLMFYDLFRPAPVYGNKNFNWMYDFIEEESSKRKVWHFPEASWWLTFDNSIPLYLPITLEARDRDIQGIKHLLSQGLEGHFTFGSGHEWGYWQNEYCSMLMAENTSFRWRDCLSEITTTMGIFGGRVQKIVEKSVEIQQRDMFDPDIIRYLVGTDPETELAKDLNISFHPLPPTPGEVLQWTEEQANQFQNKVVPRLQLMEKEYNSLAFRLRLIQLTVPKKSRNFFLEIKDGLKMMALRARHSRFAYGALAAHRQALKGDKGASGKAQKLWQQAVKTTKSAKATIKRRESGYRYLPIERSIGGPEKNWTTYPYRYHHRTSTAYYYTRIDNIVSQTITATEPASIHNHMVHLGQPIIIHNNFMDELQVESSQSETTIFKSPTHAITYPEAGEYTITIKSTDSTYEEQFSVVVIEKTRFKSLQAEILEPEGAEIIAPLIPGIKLGKVKEGKLAVGFYTRQSQQIMRDWYPATLENDDADAHYPHALKLPLIRKGSGTILNKINMTGGVSTLDDHHMITTGHIRFEDIVDTVVAFSNGAFSHSNAQRLVTIKLGLDSNNPPETLKFKVRHKRDNSLYENRELSSNSSANLKD